eukprot:6072626-Prymnesium_polylepis.1
MSDTWSLPTPTPVAVPLEDGELPVIAFYCPGTGLTAWDHRTGGAPLGNFWPLPRPIELQHNGVSGVFHNSEAAYQCLKWWQHDSTRHAFEECSAAGVEGGEQAFQFKRKCERDSALDEWKERDFDGLGKFGGMLAVLRLKWRLEGF